MLIEVDCACNSLIQRIPFRRDPAVEKAFLQNQPQGLDRVQIRAVGWQIQGFDSAPIQIASMMEADVVEDHHRTSVRVDLCLHLVQEVLEQLAVAVTGDEGVEAAVGRPYGTEDIDVLVGDQARDDRFAAHRRPDLVRRGVGPEGGLVLEPQIGFARQQQTHGLHERGAFDRIGFHCLRTWANPAEAPFVQVAADGRVPYVDGVFFR